MVRLKNCHHRFLSGFKCARASSKTHSQISIRFNQSWNCPTSINREFHQSAHRSIYLCRSSQPDFTPVLLVDVHSSHSEPPTPIDPLTYRILHTPLRPPASPTGKAARAAPQNSWLPAESSFDMFWSCCSFFLTIPSQFASLCLTTKIPLRQRLRYPKFLWKPHHRCLSGNLCRPVWTYRVPTWWHAAPKVLEDMAVGATTTGWNVRARNVKPVAGWWN